MSGRRSGSRFVAKMCGYVEAFDPMTEQLEVFLKSAREHIRPKKEKTLFALGGRGHYENPVSDLLAFFMDPQAEHGLGDVFLSAFLECLPNKDLKELPMDRVRITREEGTDNRKRIDLVVRGTGWMMLIENKIYHLQVNPVLEYMEYFKKLNGGEAPWMVVLSPDGKTDWDGWLVVSYKNYCKKLSEKLQTTKNLFPRSKWLIFANELILHLENELYTEPMDDEAIKFVEMNWDQFTHVKKLAGEYRNFLHQELRRRLIQSIEDSSARTKEDNWAIRCYGSRWGQANIAWWYDSEHPNQAIKLTVYVPNPNEAQLELGRLEFEARDEMKRSPEGSWIGWWRHEGFRTRDEAMIEFDRLAKVVEKMFRASDAPVEHNAGTLGEVFVVPE